MEVKAFTKSSSKPNLLAIKIKFNPRYRKLVEEAWKKGSPSEFFRSKIDLMKKNYIKFWNSELGKKVDQPIKNFEKSPARYNFSQANHQFATKIFKMEILNYMIIEKLEKMKY